MTHDQIRLSRIQQLKKVLRAREGKPEYEKNCELIRAEIERLDRAVASDKSEGVGS